MKIYAIYDDQLGQYFNLIEAENDMLAVRLIGQFIGKTPQDHPHIAHSDHIHLYRLGDFIQKTGKIIGRQPVHITSFKQVINDMIGKARAEQEAQKEQAKQSDQIDLEELTADIAAKREKPEE